MASTAWVSMTERRHPGQAVLRPSSRRSDSHHAGRSPKPSRGVDRLMRAWAYGLRRISMWSIPGSLTSSAKLPLPRMKRASSFRRTVRRCPFRRHYFSPGRRIGRHLSHMRRRVLHRLDDVHVAGAAAEVPADGPPDVVVRGIGVVLQQRGGSQHHSRRAEPALQAVLLAEGLLDGMQLAGQSRPSTVVISSRRPPGRRTACRT